MFANRLKIVAAIALIAAFVVGTTAMASGRVQEQATQNGVTSSTDNDEPKKKDEPKEKKDEQKDEERPTAFMGINYDPNQDDGPPEVQGVIEDGPAAKAGIKEGDKIIKINDKEIKNLEGMAKVLRTLKPGQIATIKVKRDDKEMDIKVTLGKRPTEEP